jgi:hypothetical protein
MEVLKGCLVLAVNGPGSFKLFKKQKVSCFLGWRPVFPFFLMQFSIGEDLLPVFIPLNL